MSDDIDTVPPVEPPLFEFELEGDAAPVATESDVAADAPRIDLTMLDEMSRADPALFVNEDQDPPFARQVMTTPLHFYVASESLTNMWCNWNGYSVAEHLTSIDDEYAALRNGAALTDISPLVKYRISGPDAFAWLRRFVTGNLITLSIDEVMPVVFCEDRGHVVGDGLLFRLGDSDFRLVTEEAHLAWILDSAIGHSVRIEDVSISLAALSLQGPMSCTGLSSAGFIGIETLRPYASRWFDVMGMPVYVSRSGTSGDLGYELWVEPDDAPALWLRLLDKGKSLGVKAGGFALREIARIEAGIPRAGVDYIGAFSAIDPQSALTPFELGFSSLVDLESEHFTGRDALRRARANPPRHILATVSVEWHRPLRVSAIRDETGIVGIATSSAFSPALGTNLALAVLKPHAIASGATLHIEAEMREELTLRIVTVPVRVIAGAALLLPARHLVPAPLHLLR